MITLDAALIAAAAALIDRAQVARRGVKYMARHWSGDHNAPPSPPDIRPDPADVTGLRWPGRIAADGAHPTHRIARWTIVVGIVFLAGSIAATVGLHAVPGHSPRPASGYLLTASDAHFTAMFPGRPLRIEKTAGTTSVIVYLADLPGHAVGIICAPVPAPGSFSLDRAVVVAASALPGGQVVSRRLIIYHGQPAEDAVISVLGEPGQIRVVAVGSSAYIFEGFGNTAASFAHDYKILLDSFRLLHP